MEKQKLENEIAQPQTPSAIWSVEAPPSKQTCCCCVPLKVGCFTLGYLALVTNFFNTLSIGGTLAFLGVASHGFTYLRTKQLDNGVMVPDYDDDEQAIMVDVATGMTVVFLLNLTWLLVNIYLLVGLHKKRPGYIRVHVAIATIRLIIMIISLAATEQSHSLDSIIGLCFELSLTAYFIIVYYIYAVQLEKELALKNRTQLAETPEVPTIHVTEHYAYPKYLDKQHLVEKEKF